MTKIKYNALDENHKKYCRSLGIKNTKRYRKFSEAGLLNDFDESYISEVKSYWSKYYKVEIDPVLHIAIYNLTGKRDVRIVPRDQMHNDFIPLFNDGYMDAGYQDKNIYDILIKTSRAPQIILKRVRGNFFNTENRQLNYEEAENELLIGEHKKFIVKPSNTNNGVGIELLEIHQGKLSMKGDLINLKNLSTLYGHNFTVQAVIRQHEIMKRPHPASVNTLRMVTQRWNNKIEYLLTFARFGAGNSVKDNAGAGGICVGVKEDGSFLNYAVDENCNVFKQHPTTGFSFSEMLSIPNFDKYIEFVKELHKDILHMDFISWDIAVGEDGEPVFLEANFAGATWLYQFATGQSMYGHMTEDVMEHVRLNRKINRDVGVNIKKIKVNNKKLQRKKKEMDKQDKKLKKKLKIKNKKINDLEEEVQRLRTNNNTLLNSVSWKVTGPLRGIKSILKK